MQLREEFAQIVLTHQAPLRVFVRMLGVEPSAVDDLAQDVFVVAYERWDTLQDKEHADKWLRGIARNLVRNELRKKSRRRRIINAALTELLLDADDIETGGSWRAEWLQALKTCLEGLPADRRALLAARYERDAASDDLAKELGMTADAVRQLLLRTRRQLKACVEGKLEEAFR